jgi:hypothetical protein
MLMFSKSKHGTTNTIQMLQMLCLQTMWWMERNKWNLGNSEGLFPVTMQRELHRQTIALPICSFIHIYFDLNFHNLMRPITTLILSYNLPPLSLTWVL